MVAILEMGMTVYEYLQSLRPALPMSIERPGSKENPCSPMSGGELRRHILQGGVLINHERCIPTEELDFPVRSIVFFPNGKKRTTIV